MTEANQPLVLRVFLSSPGDANQERELARKLLKDELPYRPILNGRVMFEAVSWDDPAAPAAMTANLTPQEAVNRFKRKPSDCDIVVVILWSRLGTHLDMRAFRKPSGEPYLSGTEWEFEDARNAPLRPDRPPPEILVYRKTEIPKIGLNDLTVMEKIKQYKIVSEFCYDFT